MNYSSKQIDGRKTFAAILIPIIQLALFLFVVPAVAHTHNMKIYLSVGVATLGLIAAIWLYGSVLRADWGKFKQHIWRNMGLALIEMIAAHLIIIGVRTVIGIFVHKSALALTPSMDLLNIAGLGAASVTLLGSLTALMAPFSEEIVFRHALFFQFRNRGALTWLMLIVSSVLFGLAHWNNFNGNIVAMIPYMCAGAWFAIVYYLSKNIWQNIMVHIMFDLISFVSALFLFVVTLL